MLQLYATYQEVFHEPVKTVLEIGSRDGHDAEILRSLAGIEPRKVYVVEPHPQSYRNIIANYPEFNTYQVAISEATGVLDFNAIPHGFRDPGLSSLRKHFAGHPENWIKVLSITGATLLDLINEPEIDLLKLDVEGTSLDVIKSFGDQLRRIKVMHVEVELVQFWQGQYLEHHVHEYLATQGFKWMYARDAFHGTNQKDVIFARLGGPL